MSNFKFKVGDAIQFTQEIEEFECGFENGMRARISDIVNTSDGLVDIYFDFSEYEMYNIQFMPRAYYDTNGKPTLKWNETPYYPKNKIESVMFYPNILPFFNLFSDSKPNDPPKDVNWRDLEDETYLMFPGEEIIIKTDIVTRFSYCKYIQNGKAVDCQEKVLAYAFLNK